MTDVSENNALMPIPDRTRGDGFTLQEPQVFTVDLSQFKPRIFRCSNGHTSNGWAAQYIGDRAFCLQCWADMLAAFGAEMHEVKEP